MKIIAVLVLVYHLCTTPTVNENKIIKKTIDRIEDGYVTVEVVYEDDNITMYTLPEDRFIGDFKEGDVLYDRT